MKDEEEGEEKVKNGPVNGGLKRNEEAKWKRTMVHVKKVS
jgi:hypothetical protein